MRRTIMLLTVAVMLVALLGITAGPALADHLNIFDAPEGIFEDDDEGCPDEDEEREFVSGIGFVCVDEDDLDDFAFDRHPRDFARFDRNDFLDLD